MPEAKQILYDPTLMELLDGTNDDIEGDFDPDADYNRPAPPIHDGWYFGTFSNAGIYKKGDTQPSPFRVSKWKNENKEHFEIAVKAQINKPEDPLVHEKHVYTDMALRTKPDPDRGNASGVGAAYRAMAGESIKGMGEAAHAKQLVELLQTQPQGWFRVQNVLRDKDREKEIYEGKLNGSVPADKKNPKAIYGERKIMALKGGTDSFGKFTGAADHPETGVRCAARAYLVEFKPKDFVPPVVKGGA